MYVGLQFPNPSKMELSNFEIGIIKSIQNRGYTRQKCVERVYCVYIQVLYATITQTMLSTEIDTADVAEIYTADVITVSDPINDTAETDVITETVVSKKRRRWRNGTVAKRDIKRLSASTHLLLAKRPFQRLIVEISQEFAMGLSFQKQCMESIQESSEAYILEVLKDANFMRKHAGRYTMNESDIRLAVRMRRN
jgi:histone H3